MLASTLLIAPLASDADGDRMPRLDPPGALRQVHSYRAKGVDPDGPRALVLWRWDGFRLTPLATSRSNTDGRFDFGEQPLPSGDVYFHVSVESEVADPSRLLLIERALPAPTVAIGALAPGEILLSLAHPGGEIRIYDAASGRLILRIPTDPKDPYRVFIDLYAELQAPWPTALSIEQILDRGQRSERQYWPLD